MGRVLGGLGGRGISLGGAADGSLEDAPVVRCRVDLGVDSKSILGMDSIDVRASGCATRVVSSMGSFAARADEVGTCEAVGVAFRHAAPT
jgi:hypothetical protein